VAAADIREQLWKQVPIIRAVPQMVVRVDDRQGRLDDLLVTLIEPVLPDWSLYRRHAGRGRRCRLLGESPGSGGCGAHQPGAPCQQRPPRNGFLCLAKHRLFNSRIL